MGGDYIFSTLESLEQHDVVLLQKGLAALGYDLGRWGADGVVGDQTRAAYRSYLESLEPPIPPDEDDALAAAYGRPSIMAVADADGELQRIGVAPRIVYIEPPYPMVLAWAPHVRVTRIGVNTAAEDDLRGALESIAELGSDYIRHHKLDQYGGTVNVRRRTGNPARWSTHAYGVAIDLNPLENGWRVTRPKATMPDQVIEIFERHKFINMGRIIGHDYMHFERTKPPPGYPLFS